MISNEINLYSEDWEHIIDGHPEMVGKEQLVKQAIENAIYIQEAGNPKTAAYVLGPDAIYPEGVRVIVSFPTEMWVAGNKVGDVDTSYPIDSKSYPNPDLGKIIWRKPTGNTK